MKQIITTSNSIQLIDAVQTYHPIYEKGDLYFKYTNNSLYFYKSNGDNEVFILQFPLQIDGIQYNTIDEIQNIIDSFFATSDTSTNTDISEINDTVKQILNKMGSGGTSELIWNNGDPFLPIVLTNDMLSGLAIINGQFIIVTDSKTIFRDTSGERVQLSHLGTSVTDVQQMISNALVGQMTEEQVETLIQQALQNAESTGGIVTWDGTNLNANNAVLSTIAYKDWAQTQDSTVLQNAKDYTDNSILNNTTIVKTNNTQSINGIKTFTSLPESNIIPTKDEQLTNKAYVDTKRNISTNQSIVYTTDSSGQQIVTEYTQLAIEGTIPVRNTDENIFVPSNVNVTTNNAISASQVAQMINDSQAGYIPALKDNAGQIKANYTNLSITNFTSGTTKTVPLNAATVSISANPTTVYPYNSPTDYSAMYDSSTQKLRENNVLGQVHKWRIQGTYSNKTSGNNGQLQLRFRNPDSGFIVTSESTLPTGLTTGNFTYEITTIADNASLDSGKGYILEAVTSFTDNNLTINVSSILRISQATELMAANSPLARSYSIVMPEEVFNYNGTNTYTLSEIPVVVSTIMIDHGDSFTLVIIDNIYINGKDITINNETLSSGDKIRISYSI